ncbi:MAG: DNA polymerase III subunit beta [Thermodesulfobacteriota bacterium]|nr:DNA polymerase III subunit beta [Thermodesulfobacteriota bacterium]
MLEVRIKKEELLKGVSQTQSIAEKRSSMPILSNVLLEVQEGRLAITATDLETSFKGAYEAEILGEGSLTVPARKLFEIVRGLSDEDLNLQETENYSLILSGARSKYQLLGLPPEDFPSMPAYDEVVYMEIEADNLLDMIEKTIFSVSIEETRYNLAGVFVEKGEQDGKKLLRMASTDGHRLSMIERIMPGLENLDLEKGVIISRKGMTEIKKLAEAGGTLKIGFSPKNAVVKRENTVLVIRLLEGRFPDYNLVIPKDNDKKININRDEFIETIRRLQVMSTGVKLNITPKEMVLTAINPDLGEARESILVDYEAEELKSGFNPRYFFEAASALKSDTITLSFCDSEKPSTITAQDEPGFVCVIMPVKI